MTHRRLLIVSIAALLVAACGGGGGAAPTTAPTDPGEPSGSATRIEVSLTDALKMEPATITVPAGVPVTFVVTNAGSTDHEFYLGDEAAQAEHAEEMKAGGMMHDDADGISLKARETKELTHTFAEPGQALAGCHVAGHYVVGMKAIITVSG